MRTLVASIDRMPILRFLDHQERWKLIPYFEYSNVSAGTVYLREGEVTDSLSVIVSGKLEVKKESALKGRHILCAVLESGSHIGSYSVVDRWKSYGRMTALTDTELITISNAGLRQFMEGHPYVGMKILKGIIAIQDIRLQNAMEKVVHLS